MGPLPADGAQLAAIERPAGELNHRVGATLPRGPFVVLLRRWHQCAERRLERSGAFGIEQAFQVHQPVLDVADVEIAARIAAVGLRQRRRVIDAILERLRDLGKTARIHALGGLQQVGLLALDCRRTHFLRRARQQGHMLVAHIAAREGLPGLRELFQLARDRHPLHRGPTGKLGLPAQPVDQ